MYNAIAVAFTATKSVFVRSDHKTGNRNKKLEVAFNVQKIA